MNDYNVEETKYKGYKITIWQDVHYPVDPRSWDNLGTMVCRCKGYSLGDEDENTYRHVGDSGYEDVAWYFYGLSGVSNDHEEYEGLTDRGVELVHRWIDKNIVILGLSIGDYGCNGLRINEVRGDYDDGFIYCTKDDMRKRYRTKKVTKKIKENAQNALSSEIEVYNSWCSGDVYGYSIEDEHGDDVDSCGGYFGDYLKSGLMQDAESFVDFDLKCRKKKYLARKKIELRHRVPLAKRISWASL